MILLSLWRNFLNKQNYKNNKTYNMILIIFLIALGTFCIWGTFNMMKQINKMEKDIDDLLNRAIIKFNGGDLAMLCSGCSVIIKTGAEFTPEEREFALSDKYLPPQYCEQCVIKHTKTNE